MASDLELLQAIRTNLLNALVTYGHRPNYSVDGQTFTFGELHDRLEKINSQIAALQGPVEIISEGY